MPSARRVVPAVAAVGLVVLAVIALALGSRRPALGPATATSGCVARSHGLRLQLTTGQAAIAATIAGVARQRALPERAVTIAYAAALQESHLQNLPYGDRDSVGVFQQRPSQGWGTRRQLLDPVYASSRFFAALAAVPGYQRLPIYRAAQAVQHSADGFAYSQYSALGKSMAGPFTGRLPRAVWCWFGPPPGRHRLTAAAAAVSRVFGPLPVSVRRPAGRHRRARATVLVGAASGWAVAAWLVTHADGYGISQVSYRGYLWRAGRGSAGWAADPPRQGGHGKPGPRQAAAPGMIEFS